jgi:hypothetical protein
MLSLMIQRGDAQQKKREEERRRRKKEEEISDRYATRKQYKYVKNAE